MITEIKALFGNDDRRLLKFILAFDLPKKLEHISKMVSDKNNDTSQMNESEVIFNKAIIANQNAAVVLQPSKQTFHFPSPAITTQLATILGLWLLAIGFVRRNQ